MAFAHNKLWHPPASNSTFVTYKMLWPLVITYYDPQLQQNFISMTEHHPFVYALWRIKYYIVDGCNQITAY